MAADKGVSGDLVVRIVECESRFNPFAVGDNGNSHGLVQIYMPVWGKEISIKEAQDPNFAIGFLVGKLSQGQGYLWSCY